MRATALLLLMLLLAGCGAPAPVTPVPPQPTLTPTAVTATTLHVLAAESTVSFTAEALGGSIRVEGSYDVLGGHVILTPEEGQLRVAVLVLIDTPSVTVGTGVIDEALRLGMEANAFPVATFNAESTTLVPVTEEPVAFTLAGTLTLHGQTQPVTMSIGPATVIQGHMDAAGVMDINLADFGIILPEAVVSSAITLNVVLIADEQAPPSPALET